MTSFWLIIRRISRNQLECNYLKNQKPLLEILLRFRNLHKISNILKKKHDSHSLTISQVIESEKRGYLNA